MPCCAWYSIFLSEVSNDPSTAASKLNIERNEIRENERPLELEVSNHIGQMPFLWLDISDPPGRESLRGRIERNSIALLSNYSKAPLDPPSSNWLGIHSDRERVRQSGLWNNNHVDEAYEPDFLIAMDQLITGPKN